MDRKRIHENVVARDTLRREAGLPPLDIDREVEKTWDVIAGKAASERYEALCETYATERQIIRDAVIAEMRAGGNTTFPNGWSGNYILATLVDRRFSELLTRLSDNDVLAG